MRVAVTAGYGRSLHAIALVEQLARRGCTVRLGLEVSVWTWRRLRFYLRQIGPAKLVQKARAKLTPGGPGSTYGGEVAPLQDYCRENDVRSRSFRQACRGVGARHLVVHDLNEPAALAAVRAAGIDCVVYAGGGILRPALLDAVPGGVLNAHGGPLPAFRGMNVAEWALLYGVTPEVAVIQVDAGIDTGPIVHTYPIPGAAWDSVAHGRGAAARASVEALLEAVDALQAGTLRPRPQRLEDGRQFFVMADPLLEVLAERLPRRTATVPASRFRFPEAAGLPTDGYL